MKIGYARVSSGEQNLDLQRDALSAAGCGAIHEDEGVSGAARSRPGLDHALKIMKTGDTLVTWRLDRLGRSLPHLIELVATLQERGCEFVSLNEAIDSTSAGGKLIFHIMGALAEFERDLIIERTRAGMASARARGRHLGRPVKLTIAQLCKAEDEIDAGRETVASMATLFAVDRSTLWRALRKRNATTPSSNIEKPAAQNHSLPGSERASFGHNGPAN